ncbi:MAG: hypothetical protein JO121_11685 [Deltaproteobacteria bacterium]|nr:hypothetical protein [Deltaproteobacteria bacterium]MBV8282699.1 hypothetical protein [Candidatus Eremiobacteraeota bacterium]
MLLIPLALVILSIYWEITCVIQSYLVHAVLTGLASFLFVWVAGATAPRFKLAMTLIFTVISLFIASYVLNLMGPKYWSPQMGPYMVLTFLVTWSGQAYALGVIVACEVVVCGAIRRLNLANFARLIPWLALASIVFIILSAMNFLGWTRDFESMSGNSTLDVANRLTWWFVARELALIGLAIATLLSFARFGRDTMTPTASLTSAS